MFGPKPRIQVTEITTLITQVKGRFNMGFEELLVALFGTAFVTLSFMFLPAVIETLRPQDAGPRLLAYSKSTVTISQLFDIEGEPLKQAMPPFYASHPRLSNLEQGFI